MSKELVEKISRIQSKLKAPKSQYNKFGQYAYRNQEDILEAVKPLLAAEKLMQTISDEVIAVSGRIYVKALVTVSDGESFVVVSAFAREAEDQKGMSSAQVTGSTSSYARKYALNGMYAIDDTKDADATNDHGKAAPAPTATSPATVTQANSAATIAPASNTTSAKVETTPTAKTGGRFAPKNKPAETKQTHTQASEQVNSSDDGWN